MKYFLLIVQSTMVHFLLARAENAEAAKAGYFTEGPLVEGDRFVACLPLPEDVHPGNFHAFQYLSGCMPADLSTITGR